MKKVYTVATAHLDTVWSWDFEKTVGDYIYNTLVRNFELFEKYPTYTFSFEGSYRYELMEEYYPELFKKLKEYVNQGRWNVCGSSFENGDVNIPSPEALFRNILFGNSYFNEKFGKRSLDIFLPDCFGFGWALPSIAAHANIKGFTTQKLAWGSAYGIPFDIGRWKGVDGKEIYASVNAHSYNHTFFNLRNWKVVTDKLRENEKYDLDATFVFHGTGDRGGAPSEMSVKYVEKEIKKNGKSNIEVIASPADKIYRDIDETFTDEQKKKLPVWENELVMTNHAVGGYTSRAVGKRWNRRCEELADVAERGSVMSDYLGLYDYNQKSLERSWKRFIAHQFHDDIPGTSCQRVYKRSWNDYAMSMNQFTNEIEASVAPVSSLMKTDFCKGYPVMVYNPIEAQRKGTVSARISDHSDSFARVFDENGKEVKSQTRMIDDGIMEVIFIADVKSLGTRIYDIRMSDVPCLIESSLRVTERTLENEKYFVTLNDNGDIASIIDKNLDEKELLKEPVSMGLFDYDGSKSWPAWELEYKECNRPADRTAKVSSIKIKENGAARVSLEVIQRDGKSTFSNIISLTDGGEAVEVQSEIEWQSLRTMAKNKFSFTAENEKATYDLGLGSIERGNMTEKLFEVPAQKWADITDKSGSFGVSVISECKYGWDKFDDNTLRMTVLHTPRKNYRIDSMQSFMDLGLNRYSFAIFSHEGKVGTATQLEARKFITAMTAYLCEKHDGIIGTQYSFGEVSTNDVIVRAIKKAENSDEIVVRLGEGAKKEVKNFTLSLGEGIESAREIYASEENLGEASVKDAKLVTNFAPYEIKSFALKLRPSSVSGKKAVCKPLGLDFNKNIITKQGASGDFEYTVPYEIMPKEITANGVTFSFDKDGKNAVSANGQTFEIEDGTSKIVFLCSCLDGDKKVKFMLDSKSILKVVNSAFERFAKWDLYDFNQTANIKKGKLGFEATHSHKDGKDAIAKGMYFYLCEVQVNGEKTITLPTDDDIVIIGAVMFKGSKAKLITSTYDEVSERPFNFSLTSKQKAEYYYGKAVWRLNDKGNFISHNNNGKTY